MSSDHTYIIDEQKDKQMDPEAWLITFYLFMLQFLVGVAFIIGPPILGLIFSQGWIWFLLVLIIPGIVFIKMPIDILRDMAWDNRHLTRYTLEQERITYSVWDKQDHAQSEGEVSLSSIQHAVLSGFSQENNQLLELNQQFAPPALHVIYRGELTTNLLTVPFREAVAAENWLNTFQEKNIPIYLGEQLPEGVEDDNERLAHFQNTKALQPYTLENPSIVSAPSIDPEQIDSMETPMETPDAGMEGQDKPEVNADSASPSQSKGKLTLKHWGLAAGIAYGAYIIGALLLIFLAVKGVIDDESLLTILWQAIIAYLYFRLLQPHLRWYHMLQFLVENFIITFILAIIFNNANEAAEQLATMLLGASILIFAIVWIPFLLAVKSGKKD